MGNQFPVLGTLVFLMIIVAVIVGIFLKRSLRPNINGTETTHEGLTDVLETIRLALEATRVDIWDYRPREQKIFLDECKQWRHIIGEKPEDKMISIEELKKIIHPEDWPAYEKSIMDYIAGGGHGYMEGEIRLRRADGSWYWVLSKGKAVEWDKDGAPTRIVGFDVNIQSLMEAQEKTHQSEEKFRAIFENAPYPISIRSFDKETYTEANRAFLDAFQINPKDLPGKKPQDLYSIDSKEVAGVHDELLEKGTVTDREITIVKKDEARIHLVFSSVLLDIQGQRHILTMAKNETDRKKAEASREKLQAQLLQSQKMEAVGILAGGVAHDFNNMLGAIIGYTELTMSNMAPSDPHHENLARIHDAAKRSAGLTRQLLAFARKQTISPVLLDLNKSIDALLKMLHRLIGENIELSWHPSSAPCVIRMDPSQFDQILLNLCVNARDAISDVGRIIIETESVSLDEAYNGTHDRVDPGAYALLSVSDNGCGMNREDLNRIFEPFFTTKELGQGTGMGLATVYGIVKQNKGAINVYSEPGRGTAFRIHLPMGVDKARKETAKAAADTPQSRNETILLVEDDPMLLEMSTVMLQRLGYSVLPAATPGEAIRMARETGEEIHLFITDVVMPEMNGRDLAARLQSIRPGIKHLFMSGYSASIIAPQGVLDSDSNFIQKPFSSRDLASKIREVIDV